MGIDNVIMQILKLSMLHHPPTRQSLPFVAADDGGRARTKGALYTGSGLGITSISSPSPVP